MDKQLKFQLKSLTAAICNLQSSSGDTSDLLEQILNAILQIDDTDFEIKALPPIKYCCDDDSIYFVINCRKYEGNVFIETESFIWDAQTNSEIPTLPPCAVICEETLDECEPQTPLGVLITWG